MNRHETINKLLVDFALGELPQQKETEMKTHLVECPQCSSELKQLETLLECTERIRELSADKQMCESAKQAILASVESGEMKQQTTRPNISPALIWRTIMKSPITKLAAAAVIVITVMIVIQQFGVPIDATSVAWGDVREAFLAQTLVHLKYNNDTELWYDLKEGKRYYKDWDGRCVFIDRVLNIRQVYHSVRGEHISEDRPAIYPNGVIPPWEPKTAWEAIVGHLETMPENVSVGHWEFEKSIEQVDGKRLVRFDRYYNDAVGRRLLIKQIWADPETRLPVKVWERLQLAHREEQNREFIIGEFNFPASGPSNIYDLGVSQNLPIVKEHDRIASPSVAQVFEAGKAAGERFPSRYRVIVWQNEGSHEIDIIWRDGDKVRQSRYFSLFEPYHLPVPCTATEVLQWTQTQVPVGVTMVDGEKRYRRSNPHPRVVGANSQSTIRVNRGKSLMLSSWPHDKLWPYAKQTASRFEFIQDLPQELSGCIGLRRDSGDIRREFYVDPAHDYICVKWIWWKLRSGNWEKERQYELSGFTRLPEGHWYASNCLLTTFADPERGTGQGGANWSIDIEVIDEGDYPLDVFNGEKLMEGAKVETY